MDSVNDCHVPRASRPSALREAVQDYSQAVGRLAFLYITLPMPSYLPCEDLVADIFWVASSRVRQDVVSALRDLRVR